MGVSGTVVTIMLKLQRERMNEEAYRKKNGGQVRTIYIYLFSDMLFLSLSICKSLAVNSHVVSELRRNGMLCTYSDGDRVMIIHGSLTIYYIA